MSMTKAKALEALECVISDCDHGFDSSRFWDKHSWEAMGDLLSEVHDFIKEKVNDE